MKPSYETVIGVEVHVELNTATKIFCSCPTTFGAEPNTLCCPVCAGLPGALPRLNRAAVEKAIMAGLALHCELAEACRMDLRQLQTTRRKIGKITAMTSASRHWMENITANAPTMVIPEMKISSGPWWASSVMSKRSDVSRLISWPVRFRS